MTVSLSGGWAEREGGAYAQVRKGPPRGYSTLLNAHTFLRPITDPDSLLARLPGAPKTRVQPELPDIRVRVQTDFSLVPRNRLECPTRNMLLCLRRALDSCSYYVFVSEKGGRPLAALRPVSHRSERRLENGGGSGRDDRNPKGAQS